jgi:hypothetical protein
MLTPPEAPLPPSALRKVSMKVVALGLASVFAFTSAVSAAGCLDTAIGALEARGISDWNRSDGGPVLEQVIMVQNITMGYRAWFRVDRCRSGYVIVNMRTNCTVTDIWPRGECETEIYRMLNEGE